MTEKQQVMKILNECYDNLVDSYDRFPEADEEIYDEAQEGINHLIWVISRGYPD